MPKDKYYIADVKHRSIGLLMRRAYWSNNHGYPALNGYRVDPRCVGSPNREPYQDQVTKWWDGLDPDARKFLGPDYAAMANRATEFRNHDA